VVPQVLRLHLKLRTVQPLYVLSKFLFRTVYVHITNRLHHHDILNMETWYFNKLTIMGVEMHTVEGHWQTRSIVSVEVVSGTLLNLVLQ